MLVESCYFSMCSVFEVARHDLNSASYETFIKAPLVSHGSALCVVLRNIMPQTAVRVALLSVCADRTQPSHSLRRALRLDRRHLRQNSYYWREAARFLTILFAACWFILQSPSALAQSKGFSVELN